MVTVFLRKSWRKRKYDGTTSSLCSGDLGSASALPALTDGSPNLSGAAEGAAERNVFAARPDGASALVFSSLFLNVNGDSFDTAYCNV